MACPRSSPGHVVCGLPPLHHQPSGQRRRGCPGWFGQVDWCMPQVDCGTPLEPECPRPRCYSKEELAGTGWAYCPPCVEDPRELIRPRNPQTPDSAQPSGAPYFNHSDKICPPAEAPLAIKGGFNFCDWLATVHEREPPAHLRGCCIPSTCVVCGPEYVDCCPHTCDPKSFTIAKAQF